VIVPKNLCVKHLTCVGIKGQRWTMIVGSRPQGIKKRTKKPQKSGKIRKILQQLLFEINKYWSI
jgi:hypothetical protein